MRLRLAWITPEAERQQLAAAVAAARSARTAIVVAWDEAGEGHDRRALDLPWQQDRLIEAVARANPRTIVVLATAAPVLMPWLPQTAAVLETWYPGVEGADALSAILLGEADPGGRLPVTFPADPGQTPTSSPERYPGIDGVADYSEGLLVGYRWYDATGPSPCSRSATACRTRVSPIAILPSPRTPMAGRCPSRSAIRVRASAPRWRNSTLAQPTE